MATNKLKKAPEPTIDPSDPRIHRWDNGLVLYNEFMTEDEEAAMIKDILADTRWTGAGKRLSLHFGPRFDYTNNMTLDPVDDSPLPTYITNLLSRLPIQEYLPDQFTVQYYPPGAGIPPHVDTHSAFREALYSLSFGSAVPMAFKRCGSKEARKARIPNRTLVGNINAGKNKSTSSTPEPKPSSPGENEEDDSWELFLPPRSLLLMLGPSRYGFTHKIRGRKFDQKDDGEVVERKGRYSITMRKVNRGDEIACSCDFPDVCDARIREEMQRASGEDEAAQMAG
ncbi:hypothetical protein BP6252_07585 [Coleophoma cylindrospora]|uniref:Fe2OG dioxygenase domain-containing protein n=1 Tax=Coleophoma cylindrospora TaxID=1849047 RepID=A0A3D8RAE5_9HELO|nr:hypothetical protein BP6252_07585 [Coleophoma cylindrospora]